MSEFFRGLIKGDLIEGAKDLPFQLLVSAFRRKMLINAMISENTTLKFRGEKVLRAYTKQVAMLKSKKQNISTSMDHFMEFYNNLDINDPLMPNPRSGFPKMPKIIGNEEKK